jgi:hypothetical protein
MHFDLARRLNDEQLEFKDLCRRFSSEVIRPVAPKHDAEESEPFRVDMIARARVRDEAQQRLRAFLDGQR